MEREIRVLLSLYGEAPFLTEQLESLERQTYKKFKITVRADDANDSSIDQCKSIFPSVEVCTCIKGNLGINESYLHLLSHARDKEFVSFCDQDDVWLDFKLMELQRSIGEGGEPQLSSGQAIILGSKLLLQPKSFSPSREKSIFENYLLGSNILINDSAVKLLLSNPPPIGVVYDDWLQFLVQFFGKVSFLQKPLMLYRIHKYNATGAPYRSRNKLIGAYKFWKNIESADARTLKKMQFLHDSGEAAFLSGIYESDSLRSRVNYVKLRTIKFEAFQFKAKSTLFILYQLKIFVATFFINLRRRV